GLAEYGTGYGNNDSEVFPLQQDAKDWVNFDVSAAVKTRGAVANDFNPEVADNAEVNKIINWVRGEDQGGMRSRQIEMNGALTTWRLGDIIHSTPMTVAAPAEGYHFLYGDLSYAQFYNKYNKRRHVIYFGGNDGMLHAVNGGFYDSEYKKFCRAPLSSAGICPANDDVGTPELGAELWAYVPYNLLPHLQCLTQPDYKHKYMVDLRPRIFDAQIFFESDGVTSIDPVKYPNGWGTILVGGMRLGGIPVDASTDLTLSDPNDTRRFISSYFILDITDPETPPVLLGELTQTHDPATPNSDEYVDLGHSTVISSMVIMKETNDTVPNFGDDSSKWYLILGSGPHGPDAMKGVSDQFAKISILPLDGLVTDDIFSPGTTATRALRIADETIAMNAADGGTMKLSASPNGFVSDPITIDFDISPSSFDYRSDAVYFGTVEGNFATHSVTGLPFWDGGGTMYRLITRQTAYHPSWNGGLTYQFAHGVGVVQLDTTPDQWFTNILLEPFEDLNRNGVQDLPDENGQPITASPSVGYDGHNFWVYFGTGRFFDADDKGDPTQQSYYGIKEPMQWITNHPSPPREMVRKFLWDENDPTYGRIEHGPGIGPPVEGDYGVNLGSNPAGQKGLLKVDEILVPESARASDALLLCRDTTTGEIRGGLMTPDLSCLPTEIVVDPGTDPHVYFDHTREPNLVDYIAGREVTSGAVYNDVDECVSPHPSGSSLPPYQNCVDGWYKDFWPYGNRERNVGQATLLGGLVTFTTYQPYSDMCLAEGVSTLYGLYYQTGTPWYEDILGTFTKSNRKFTSDKFTLGLGLATTPNLHVGSGNRDGSGTKAFVQTSTGEIKEVRQDNLPLDNYRTGRSKWKEGTCSP
ncbi:MAG: hypothetical protein OEM01_14430, partial [Desulfobulbaceae bacterium]|nr:hypothetical protein [Desulfobulbaceae bacterium]